MKPRTRKLPLATPNKGSKFTTHGRNSGRASQQLKRDRTVQNVMDGIFNELMPSVAKGTV